MKFHTYFSRQQRLAVVLLILIIISLELFLVSNKSSPSDLHKVDPQIYVKFQKEVDSLIVQKRNQSTPKIYPFNPNYITDHKGYTLGMSTTEINRLCGKNGDGDRKGQEGRKEETNGSEGGRKKRKVVRE